MDKKLDQVETDLTDSFEEAKSILQAEFNEVNKETADLREELDTTLEEVDTLNSRIITLEKDKTRVEKDAHDASRSHQDEMRRLELVVSDVRGAKMAKEEEFNELMDIKISLEAEITQYVYPYVHACPYVSTGI
jgi:predicted  nucleic acid-binding Zn-ribbon protein